jgi:asparagine synthetase B (glutamine-hydrolysing)
MGKKQRGFNADAFTTVISRIRLFRDHFGWKTLTVMQTDEGMFSTVKSLWNSDSVHKVDPSEVWKTQKKDKCH